MDAVGKFATSVAIVMSVVDVVLDIIDIVDIVEQSKKMCDELNTTIRANYKSYFNGIKDASKQYNAAIHGPVVTIESVTFPNVFLRIDGAEVTSFLEKGGGTVNSQYGTHEAEKFKISKSSDGYYTIESVKFPNVFLRMDGEEVTSFLEKGGGIVNCQYGAQAWERYKIKGFSLV